jgi:hypothetical protein
MYTSLVLAMVMGPGAAPRASALEAPTWQNDYVAARKRGHQENKALAVFFGSGQRGWEKVCLENDFDITQGLVVSTRDGESQAFRQKGRISGEDLEFALRRFANGYRNNRTETLQELQLVGYGAPVRPAAVPAPVIQSFGGFGGFSGRSC